MFHRFTQLALILLLLAAPLPAAKKKGMQLQLVSDQVSDMHDLRDVPAKKNCEGWGWAAVVESMLLYRNVNAPLQQQFWIDKVLHGQGCGPDSIDYQQAASLIDDDYNLDDQRKLRLENRFYPGVSIPTDSLIVAMREQRPLLVLWKQHPYLLYGVAYDEYIGPNGNRMFMVQKMSLADPLGAPRDHRFVVFDRTIDDINEIDGVMDIVVLPPILQ